jgi:hypothetical protein
LPIWPEAYTLIKPASKTKPYTAEEVAKVVNSETNGIHQENWQGWVISFQKDKCTPGERAALDKSLLSNGETGKGRRSYYDRPAIVRHREGRKITISFPGLKRTRELTFDLPRDEIVEVISKVELTDDELPEDGEKLDSEYLLKKNLGKLVSVRPLDYIVAKTPKQEDKIRNDLADITLKTGRLLFFNRKIFIIEIDGKEYIKTLYDSCLSSASKVSVGWPDNEKWAEKIEPETPPPVERDDTIEIRFLLPRGDEEVKYAVDRDGRLYRLQLLSIIDQAIIDYIKKT